jgi:hypothetical protein
MPQICIFYLNYANKEDLLKPQEIVITGRGEGRRGDAHDILHQKHCSLPE